VAILKEPFTEVLELQNYVDGEWVDSEGEMRDVVNPATMQPIARVPRSTAAEFDAAVAAAKAAYPEWRRTPPLARARCMFRLKELLEENFEEVSRIQTMEHGKTIDESRGETRRGIEMVEVATGIPTLMQGYNLEDIASGIDEYLIRQPLGVFGIIGPFNFPFMVPLWFAPFAVATGNCIIVKPSSEDPISQCKIVELAEEAGVPEGVWNLVNGGREVVSAMTDHPDIQGVCFVGSTPVGRDVVYERCGTTGKRVICQCGAKNFAVVMPDADVDRTVAACMTSFYGNTGQRCLALPGQCQPGDVRRGPERQRDEGLLQTRGRRVRRRRGRHLDRLWPGRKRADGAAARPGQEAERAPLHPKGHRRGRHAAPRRPPIRVGRPFAGLRAGSAPRRLPRADRL
jgi:malonate-semialdehyde dehydrogenase (acetylating)/methylmalonate-semialdehyde dehydrogenase